MTTGSVILLRIDQLIREKGFSPSVREIGEASKLKYTSTVQKHLNGLRDNGFINFIPQSPRTITITEEGKKLIEKLNNS